LNKNTFTPPLQKALPPEAGQEDEISPAKIRRDEKPWSFTIFSLRSGVKNL